MHEKNTAAAPSWHILIALLLLSSGLNAQESSIRVGPTTSISRDDPDIPLGETWLARNPRDPNNLIATSMAFSRQGPWASVMYATLDGGSSWQRVTRGPKHEAYFWGADPVVIFGSDGMAYYSDLEAGSVGDAPFDEDPRSYGVHANVFMFRSPDGGRTWSEPIALYGDDHTCIAIDESLDSKYRGRVYSTYTTTQHSAQGEKTKATIGFSYSDDKGATYRQRVFLPPEGLATDQIEDGPSPTDLMVAPDGTVVLAYVAYLRAAQEGENGRLLQQTWVISSSDGGRTFSQPSLAESVVLPRGPGSRLNIAKVAYWPRMAIDSSQGPRRGRLYLAYENYVNDRVGIAVVNSRNNGRTWSSPVQVNDDHTSATDNTPGIAVSENGVVGVSWYDRRNDPKDLCFQEYFSASLDGGVSFLPNVVVHRPPTCTLRPANWQPNVSQRLNPSDAAYQVILSSPGPRFMNAGETQGIAGMQNGKFQLAWINGESGVMQLASTALEVTARPFGTEVGELLEVTTERPTLDPDGRFMTTQVSVTNRSRRALKTPLTLVLTNTGSVFEGLQASNADNALVGVGAWWHLPSASSGQLQPGEHVGPVTLKFGFKKIPDKPWEGSPLDVAFHIFASDSQ